ncbi:hypothetical protein HRbin01_01752 [archaeon HR01]|nr:hypothetical protein HRbin01_01752 [archaeon HR01]
MATRLKKNILKLLKEDEEFRYAVAGLIGLEEILKRLDSHEAELVRLREDMVAGFNRHDEELARLREETNRLREDMIAGFRRHDEELARLREETNRLREDMIAGFKRHDEEIAKLREDMIAGFKRHDEEMAKLREDMVTGFKRHDEEIAKLREDMNRGFDLLSRHLTAIGARWGIMAESAFREGLKGILEKELGLTVEKWSAFDESGVVHGYPSTVDIDISVRDGVAALIEVKSHLRRSDVAEFSRKIEFYIRKTGRTPDRRLIVTPYADAEALEAAEKLGIEVYTQV